MKRLKRIGALGCLWLLAATLLSGCGTETSSNPSNQTKRYKTDVAITELASVAHAKIAQKDVLTTMDDNYITLYIDLDLASLDGYAMYCPASGETLDEYGLFKAKDEAGAAAVETALKAYLQMRNDEWTGMYMVDQYPKLEKASVRVFGRYVVYAILSDAERNAVFAAVEETLTA